MTGGVECGAADASVIDRARQGPFRVVGVGTLTGLVVGLLTSPLQGWLPDSVQSLANSAGPWSLVAFLVARRASNLLVAVLTASLTLGMCEIG